MERFSNEPISQNTISVMAKGLGDKAIRMEVAAPAKLPTASPANKSTKTCARWPANKSNSHKDSMAMAMAASGRTQDKAPANPV